MVTGMELMIPLFLDVGPIVFKRIMKLIPKKGKRDFESIVNSILKEMNPLVEAMKRDEGTGTKTGPAGVAEDLKQLIQTVEKGNQLVKKRKKHEELKEWMDSFWVSLSSAMFRVLLRMAANVNEIKQQLLPNQSPQINFHLYFSDEKYKMGYKELIQCVNMFGGPETPVPETLMCGPGVESVSTDNTKDAKPLKQSVPETRKVVAVSEIPKCVDNPTEPALKKVVFEVLARDNYGKIIVEKAACNVKGVICAERVVQDNQERDLIIVIATDTFVVKDMIEYLKKKLRRKHVYVKEK